VAEKRREKPLPWFSLLVPPNPDSKTGGHTVLVATRPYRSKFTTVVCFCKRRRKDGGCRTLDGIVPLLAHPDRVRFQHPKVDDRVFRAVSRKDAA
jgi:hypothetical protein